MTTTWIIAIIAIVIALLILFIVLGLRRRRNKTVSFTAEDGEKTKELTQQEKSGNYQALGGFQFSAGGQQREKEVLPGQELASAPRAGQAAQPVTPEEPVTSELADAAADGDQSVTPASEDTQESPAQPAAATEPVAEVVPEPAETAPVAEPVASEPVVEEPGVEEPVADEPAEEPVEQPVDQEPAPALEEHDAAEAIAAPEAFELPEEDPTEPAAAPVLEEQPAAAEAATTDATDTTVQPAAAPVASASAASGQPEADTEVVEPETPAEPLDEIEPAAGRLGKLRGRLSRSQNVFGQAVLGMLTAGDLDEDAWEEIEDQLIAADLGVKITMNVVEELRDRIATHGVSSEEEARAMLRDVLIKACKPELDRSIKAMPYDGKPAVILVVGVNGTGKTTTTGKLARVLVSMGHSVVLGAADTFRAAAADQLETWGRRVGATTVRGKEAADPASVAFDSVAKGIEQGADVVLIDTAGRLHNSANLMDQLGKVKRVVEKKAKVDEVLLVLDATTGQNGMIQARTFADVVQISGVVLTKLDGSAKGGIVFQVQEELGVPVKLVGLGEGADHLAPFEVESFVDALLN